MKDVKTKLYTIMNDRLDFRLNLSNKMNTLKVKPFNQYCVGESTKGFLNIKLRTYLGVKKKHKLSYRKSFNPFKCD